MKGEEERKEEEVASWLSGAGVYASAHCQRHYDLSARFTTQ